MPSSPNHSMTVHALNAFCCSHVCSQMRNQLGGDRTTPQQSCETNQTSWTVTRGSPCSLPTLKPLGSSAVLLQHRAGEHVHQLHVEQHIRLINIPSWDLCSSEFTLQNNGRIHTGDLILLCSKLLLIYTKQMRAKSAQILYRHLC